MRLVINEQKTKIYDLTRERMKFLGYEFFVFRQNTTNPKKRKVHGRQYLAAKKSG